MREILRAFADNKSDGSPVYEEIVAEALGSGRYRLIQSPGFVLGIAAGDIFSLDDRSHVHVLERGQNLCIQIFFERAEQADQNVFDAALGPLQARLDGKTDRVLVYTVPVAAGFSAVESSLNAATEVSGGRWYYGNVYDPRDGVTPLRWWE